jgi:hypothetical protein
MRYLGRKPLSETAPNHPFVRPQISFGVKQPESSRSQSLDEKVSEAIQAPLKPKSRP